MKLTCGDEDVESRDGVDLVALLPCVLHQQVFRPGGGVGPLRLKLLVHVQICVRQRPHLRAGFKLVFS